MFKIIFLNSFAFSLSVSSIPMFKNAEKLKTQSLVVVTTSMSLPITFLASERASPVRILYQFCLNSSPFCSKYLSIVLGSTSKYSATCFFVKTIPHKILYHGNPNSISICQIAGVLFNIFCLSIREVSSVCFSILKNTK